MPTAILNRPLHAVLYGSMAALLVFAVCFDQLRVCFSDTAGYLTDMTRNNGFAVSHGRFVAILNQWLPALLLQLGAPLKAVVLAYSLNYSLVPVILALACMHWLKRPYHALAIMLLVLLMNVLLFYYSVSELQMGLCLLLFYDAVADDAEGLVNRKRFIIATVLLVPFITFSHPMSLPVFAGWLAYRLLRDRKDYANAAIAAGGYCLSYLIKKLWFTSGYEAGKMLSWETIRPFGLNYYGGPFARSIYEYIIAEAFTVPLVLLAAAILLIRMKRYRLLALLILAPAGLFTIVLITFEDWGSHFYDHYYEHMLQPAIFFIALLFCYALSRLPGRDYWKAGGVALILIVSFAKINSGSESHIARQRWMYGYLELMDGLKLKKAVAGRVWVPEGMVRGTFWSASWESLLLSSLSGPEGSKTLFLSWDIARIGEPIGATDEFVTDGWAFKQSTLPARYFKLNDRPYVILEHIVPDSVLEHLRWR